MLLDELWDLVEQEKKNAKTVAIQSLECIESLSGEDLGNVFIHYEHFLSSYPKNLAFLISNLPSGLLQTSLSSILSDELGNGNLKNNHRNLLKDFTKNFIGENYQAFFEKASSPSSLGVSLSTFLENQTRTRTTSFGVGMIGMGGECVCELYLGQFYQQFTRNLAFIDKKPVVDMKFWEIHLNKEEAEHEDIVVRGVNDYLSNNPQYISEVAQGFLCNAMVWKDFWMKLPNLLTI